VQKSLAEMAGLSEFTLNPFAGAHGELTGLMTMRTYHTKRGDLKRTKVIVPDSAHGTNPASAAVCGLEVVEVKSTPEGTIDVEDLKPLLDNTIAGIMMTNPNTLGIFEKEIPEIAKLVHACGGLLYYDGANLNPLLGKCRPGDMGFDIMHINLHKTFSTPHGGGGPGSGPIGVRAGLEKYLPNPRVRKTDEGKFMVDFDENSLGTISGFLGNFAVVLRAYAYILTLGKENVKMVGPLATLNANYVKESLKSHYLLPIEGICKHEFVFDGLIDKSTDVTTLDVAKRLLDYGFHAPTIYFPMLFHQALMIEPTENESKETLDEFIAIMKKIAEEAISDPDNVKSAPHNTPVRRLDDTLAAKHPIVTYAEMLNDTPSDEA
jgi:glycine dehydrogenase subunit 2